MVSFLRVEGVAHRNEHDVKMEHDSNDHSGSDSDSDSSESSSDLDAAVDVDMLSDVDQDEASFTALAVSKNVDPEAFSKIQQASLRDQITVTGDIKDKRIKLLNKLVSSQGAYIGNLKERYDMLQDQFFHDLFNGLGPTINATTSRNFSTTLGGTTFRRFFLYDGATEDARERNEQASYDVNIMKAEMRTNIVSAAEWKYRNKVVRMKARYKRHSLRIKASKIELLMCYNVCHGNDG
ncbi:hypothetical protein CC86DRAFT_404824 [Ophiobolus disseminans]|uniref:Uncharacterized protein n=1 Tax=Ophiobolus disseminans TaxID=1469910 RepID=A0A6A7A518_9PLEO|nr:hypothetical protein CC86DRAFT_404824 [Ophiobolus disseminans]